MAVRLLRQDSDTSLPAYLKPLLGGMDNLRGFHAGSAVGDTLVAMSAEVIVPISSPLEVGKVGVSVFVDRGTGYNKGERFSDQTLKDGYGGGAGGGGGGLSPQEAGRCPGRARRRGGG